jgi:CHAT domain-containing protein
MQGRLQSNELFGFPWALAAAGASNAVVSRWLLPQAANARWVPTYYAALARGQVPSAAAAEAARAMLSSGDRHPHGWAAMQVIGR